MDWIETLGETRARLLRLMRAEARSVSELAEAVGVTTNAVRTHLAALERDGLVQPSGLERATGGKPARLYEVTVEAEELFPKAYALVLRELLGQLREEGGSSEVEATLRRVGRRLTGRTPRGASGGEAGVRVAAALLESIGGAVEVEPVDDGWVLSSAGCPLSGVVRSTPVACVVAESLVADVTGLRVEERCVRGDRPRCAFHVSPV